MEETIKRPVSLLYFIVLQIHKCDTCLLINLFIIVFLLTINKSSLYKTIISPKRHFGTFVVRPTMFSSPFDLGGVGFWANTFLLREVKAKRCFCLRNTFKPDTNVASAFLPSPVRWECGIWWKVLLMKKQSHKCRWHSEAFPSASAKPTLYLLCCQLLVCHLVW